MADRTPIRMNILKRLKDKEGFVSGGELCTRYGITRAAVWKQIQELRRKGYGIEGVPSTGYRLVSVPDVLSEPEISDARGATRIGSGIHILESTGSTNEDAWRRAQNGAEEGEVVIAETQTGGRGRKGRLWASPKGVNVYASVILRPQILPFQAPLITLLAAVAIVEVIREGYDLDAGIKWPNDVLLEGKKVAGILSEMSAEADQIHFLILGMGINLNMTPDMFPKDLLYPATSLYLVTGKKVQRSSFAGALLRKLDHWYDIFLMQGGKSIRDAWLTACIHHGQALDIDTPAGRQKGWFAGLDDEGCLLLKNADSEIKRIHAGDVIRSVPGDSYENPNAD